MFSQDRAKLREGFVVAWRKHLQSQPLTPLEAQIVDVVQLHPEYHAVLDNPESVHADFAPGSGQSNPYLHMAMHLTLREQKDTDRPPGVRVALLRLKRRLGDAHAAEHVAMECLSEVLWTSQSTGRAPDDKAYLNALRQLATGKR